MTVVSFRDASDVTLFAIYTNSSGGSSAKSTMGVAVGPLSANPNGYPVVKKDLAGLSINVGGSSTSGNWFNIKAEINLITQQITFNITGINGTSYSGTETLNLPAGYQLKSGIKTVVFNIIRTANVYGTAQLTNLCIKDLDDTVTDTPYQIFMNYVATVQAVHDAETNTTPFITAIKATLQTAIDAAEVSVNASSTEAEIDAAKTTLEAALTAFNDAKAHFTALQTAITTAQSNLTAVQARIGREFLNFLQADYDVYAAAVAAANTALSTVATDAALDAAKTDVENAYTTLYAARIAPLPTAYRIYSYGIDGGTGIGNKKVLYTDGVYLLYKESNTADNDLWIITQTQPNVYTVQNLATGLYINGSGSAVQVTSAPVEFTMPEVKDNVGAIYFDASYFLYSILNSSNRALEVDLMDNPVTAPVTGCGTFTQTNAVADRARFAFQFEPVPTPFVIEPEDSKTISDYLSGYYTDIIFKSNETSTGQLTIPEGETLTVNGVVKLQKTFIPVQWYPIGFPFDVNSFYCDDIKSESDAGILQVYNGTAGDFWVKSYDGNVFDYSTANSLAAGTGYIIQFPSAFASHEITFTSDANPVLKNTTALPVALADNAYTLVANPSTANVSSLEEASNYYLYNSTGNQFSLLEGTAPALKPFEALIVVKNPVTPLRAIYVEEQETGLELINTGDQLLETRYYSLQGVEIPKPEAYGIFIAKKIYTSGKAEMVKICINKK